MLVRGNSDLGPDADHVGDRERKRREQPRRLGSAKATPVAAPTAPQTENALSEVASEITSSGSSAARPLYEWAWFQVGWSGGLALARRGLAALPAGRLLLRGRPALR
jgi:hypothetical protein